MSRVSYILVAVVVVVASAAVVGWSFFGLGTTPVSKTQQAKQATQSGQLNKNFPKTPVSLAAKAVKAAAITYTFQASIKEIKNTSQGLELVTGIKAKKVPRFVVTDKTKILRTPSKGEKAVAATASNLAVNQRVRILALYDMKTKTWITERVNILSSSSSEASTAN